MDINYINEKLNKLQEEKKELESQLQYASVMLQLKS